ncbi:MAG: hypothetical protein QOE70_3598 [Chthoniobacter sp.]|jgi:3-hydroxyisobutyrate dehydrogenase-like beta-hydroxyacid dehydrogenase|nr:hypothetical protein [Chthoniobacter sp.]
MPRKSRKNVGLIGLGIIGSRVATGLRAAGFQAFVWNRTPKPAPNFLGSPAEVAELCEIIQIFVSDAQALFEILEQMADALTPQHVIICNATVGPEATLEAARFVEERDAHFLDAPFTGSKAAAEKRDLVYYIGGDDATFLRARPVLEASSRAIVRIGEVGHAATLKVVTNMITAVSIQTLAEALAIVQKAGLDPEVLAAALEHNACRSPAMEMKLPKMIAGNYEPHFSLKHMFKDVQLGIHVANALDIEIPATTVTAGVMYGALNQGWGELDFCTLYKVYEAQVKSSSGDLPPPPTAQLQDLDKRQQHYPETKLPAPPRPSAEAAKSAEPPPPAPVSEDEKKADAPRLAQVLDAPEKIKAESEAAAAAAVAAPDSAELRREAELDRQYEPAIHKADMPGLILLAPVEAAKEQGVIQLGNGEVGKSEPAAVAPPKPEESKPNEREAAPAVARVSEPVGTKPEEQSAALNLGPTPPKANEKPAPIEVLKAVEPIASKLRDAPEPATVESRPAAASPAGNHGGAEDDYGEVLIKPFNFVKRWFVSRIGG